MVNNILYRFLNHLQGDIIMWCLYQKIIFKWNLIETIKIKIKYDL